MPFPLKGRIGPSYPLPEESPVFCLLALREGEACVYLRFSASCLRRPSPLPVSHHDAFYQPQGGQIGDQRSSSITDEGKGEAGDRQ